MLRNSLRLVMFCLVAVGCDGENPVVPTGPTEPTGPPQSLAISGTTTFQGDLGTTSQLAAIARYPNGSSENVNGRTIWQSSDPLIVTVSGTGLLTTVGYGDAEVSAQFEGLTARADVAVMQPTDAVAQSVEISGTTTFQALRITSQLAAIAQFSDGSSQDVRDQSIWETSDSAVVTVSGTGLLTTVGFGDAEVTARFQSLTASKPVSVTQPPPRCSLMLSEADTFNRNGGSGSVAVQIEENCFGWTASTDVGWITLVGSNTGNGPGMINFVVTPLTNETSRTGQITVRVSGIPDQSVLIRQENTEGPQPPFRYFVTPESRTVGSHGASYTVTVTSSRPDAEWTAASNQPWLVVHTVVLSPLHEGERGTGQALVTYRVEQNPLNVERIGTITVEGTSHQNPPAVHTVTQRGRF